MIRCNEHLGINKNDHKLVTPNPSSIGDHAKQTGHVASLDNFQIISRTDNSYDLLIHQSLLIQREIVLILISKSLLFPWYYSDSLASPLLYSCYFPLTSVFTISQYHSQYFFLYFHSFFHLLIIDYFLSFYLHFLAFLLLVVFYTPWFIP